MYNHINKLRERKGELKLMKQGAQMLIESLIETNKKEPVNEVKHDIKENYIKNMVKVNIFNDQFKQQLG